MNAEKDLQKLLLHMSPKLTEGDYVFCSFPQARYGDHADLDPIGAFWEAEGLTLILPKARADERKIGYESVFRQITLEVHSSLDAVGLTAAFSGKLAEHGLSANVVAGYFHDHIFVRSDAAESALDALRELSR